MLHYECIKAAHQIAKETTLEISDELAALVTETAFRFTQVLVTDVEAFAQHAHRSIINLDDLRLFVRRNPYLVCFAKFLSTTFYLEYQIEVKDTQYYRGALRLISAEFEYDSWSLMDFLIISVERVLLLLIRR